MKSVYVKFDVASETYEEASLKVKETFEILDEMLKHLQLEINPDILKTRQFVNKVKM